MDRTGPEEQKDVESFVPLGCLSRLGIAKCGEAIET